MIFEWGIAAFDLEIDEVQRGEKTWAEKMPELKAMGRKAGKQALKDFVVFPALSGPSFVPARWSAACSPTSIRNVWSHAVIFCGHFPVEVETFDEERLENETQAEWYVRQMLGSANIEGSKLLHIMTGNLSHQIEHHLFPDMPSNRYRHHRAAGPRPVPPLRAAVPRGPDVEAVRRRAGQDRPPVVPRRPQGPRQAAPAGAAVRPPARRVPRRRCPGRGLTSGRSERPVRCF